MSVDIAKRPHDPLVCGIDPDTDCPVCRPNTARLFRMERVRAKIEDEMGICLGDLANLFWDRLEDVLEPVIERMVMEILRRRLKGARLTAYLHPSLWPDDPMWRNGE